ncbi:MAG: PilZ domain-containing protein [Planctomycetes bacterium]|nr:PilZ domain-containing protein [Planctomycetota bacterium]MCK5578952.1 PilZ domain-containing protein [Planctomycetota bacterium]
MNPHHGEEKREFIRVKLEIPIRYKFLCRHIQSPEIEKIYQGKTTNISGGGLLLFGIIPNLAWVPELLMQKIVMGVTFLLPDETDAVKCLARGAWIETIDEKTKKCNIGLKFQEITAADKDKIFRFIIKAQLPRI